MPEAARPGPRVGLCSVCTHARQVISTRGSTFWLCSRAQADPRFRKYPPLPVLTCPGFEALRDDLALE